MRVPPTGGDPPGSFGYFLWQWYARVRSNPPGGILDAIMYGVFAFGSLGHWSTYAFVFLFVSEVSYIAVEQWYQWRCSAEMATYELGEVPTIYRSPEFAQYTSDVSSMTSAIQGLYSFEMFLRLLHDDKEDFKSVVFAHHLTRPAVVSGACPSPMEVAP